MHVAVLPPYEAVTTTRLPFLTEATETNWFEIPVMTGRVATARVSTVIESAEGESPSLPAASSTWALTVHVPSSGMARSHPEAASTTTYAHVTVTVPFTALTVTASPADRPGTFTSGVESFVMLS